MSDGTCSLFHHVAHIGIGRAKARSDSEALLLREHRCRSISGYADAELGIMVLGQPPSLFCSLVGAGGYVSRLIPTPPPPIAHLSLFPVPCVAVHLCLAFPRRAKPAWSCSTSKARRGAGASRACCSSCGGCFAPSGSWGSSSSCTSPCRKTLSDLAGSTSTGWRTRLGGDLPIFSGVMVRDCSGGVVWHGVVGLVSLRRDGLGRVQNNVLFGGALFFSCFFLLCFWGGTDCFSLDGYPSSPHEDGWRFYPLAESDETVSNRMDERVEVPGLRHCVQFRTKPICKPAACSLGLRGNNPIYVAMVREGRPWLSGLAKAVGCVRKDEPAVPWCFCVACCRYIFVLLVGSV